MAEGNAEQAGQFGVNGVQAKRDWPCLTLQEAQTVLAHYKQGTTPERMVWHSMRPFSAAALVQISASAKAGMDAAGQSTPPADTPEAGSMSQGGVPPGHAAQLVIKRHHVQIRSAAALEEEHAFIRHLAQKDVPVALPLVTVSGHTAVTLNDWVYEVFPPAAGHDAYRDVMSWQPYHSVAHASAAGQALARVHLAAADDAAPTRGDDHSSIPAGRPLISSLHAITQPDLLAALRDWSAKQPGLPEQLANRNWQEDVQTVLVPLHARLRPLLHDIVLCWGHGDWHGSNLFWQDKAETHHVAPYSARAAQTTPESGHAQVAAVLDFGMADRTCVPFDIAVALERSMVDWLNPTAPKVFCYAQLHAFLEGYEGTRPLTEKERALVVAFLPLVHTEFALSEVAYFGTLLRDADSCTVAYDAYFLGHARWFLQPEGQALLDWLSAFRPSGRH